MPAVPPSESEIRDWCLDYLRQTVDAAAIAIGPDIPFTRMGLDSASAAYFVVELEEWLGTELYPEIIFDHATVADLARHIAGRQNPGDAA